MAFNARESRVPMRTPDRQARRTEQRGMQGGPAQLGNRVNPRGNRSIGGMPGQGVPGYGGGRSIGAGGGRPIGPPVSPPGSRGHVVPTPMRDPVRPGQQAESDVDPDFWFPGQGNGPPGGFPPGFMKKFGEEPMRVGGLGSPFGGAPRFRAPRGGGRSRAQGRRKIGRRNSAANFGAA